MASPTGLGPLGSGGRVVIVGGGPAGVACALTLQRAAIGEGRALTVTILEGKEFVGERHYNQCVGVLSPPLADRLQTQLGIAFPHHLVRAEIEEYVLHTARTSLTLKERGIVSQAVRRVQFDAFMLEQARERGVSLVPARAVDLEFHQESVVVYTEAGSLEADVVVGAFGMDDGAAATFQRASRYRPPQALASVVTKYHPGDEAMQAFGPRIHAFLPRDKRIEFGSVTPKGNHLTINIAGSDVDSNLMASFLRSPEVRGVLPNLDRAGDFDPQDLTCFKGRFPVSLAREMYDDRWVMVGDAAGLVRAFKGKGVTSAIETGVRAAEAILRGGISESAFHEHYLAANRDVIRDVPFGRAIRLLVIGLATLGLFDVIVEGARREPLLHQALFEAVSGHSPYREVWAKGLAPRSLAAIARAAAHEPLRVRPSELSGRR
jgi:flavin-dependent dehydrogenase